MSVKLLSLTEDAERLIAYCARVSSPNRGNPEYARLLKYMARNRHWCYDKETEIFTPDGWVKFSELSSQTKVAEVTIREDGTPKMRFTTPQAINATHYKGNLIACSSSTCDYAVTPNHRMYAKNPNNGGGRWSVAEAKKLFKKPKRMHTCAILEVPGGTGSYDEGFYTGFLLGEGTRTSKNKVVISLKDTRKIEAISEVIESLGLNYTFDTKDSGSVEFNIADSDTHLGKCPNKELPSLAGKSADYLRGLFMGLLESDGSVDGKGCTFSNSSKKLFDGFLTLATMCGYSTSKIRTRYLDNENHSINYSVTVLGRKTCVVNSTKGADEEEEREYDGLVYCVTVPSGLLLVRRNGKQLVCGNSPFEMAHAVVEFKTSRAIATQLLRHRSFSVQEFSQRYSEASEPVIYPARRQDTKNRQNSFDDLNKPAQDWWESAQKLVWEVSNNAYQQALKYGIAKECARFVLPLETETTLCMAGSLRSWHHFFEVRCHPHAQKECQDLAYVARELLADELPELAEALGWRGPMSRWWVQQGQWRYSRSPCTPTAQY